MNWKISLNIKQIIYIAIALILFIWIISSQIKCNRLKKEINQIKIQNLEKVDSLNFINNQHLKRINTYELEISKLNSEIDSLQKVKNKIIIKKDEVLVANGVSDAANNIKKNLARWND